MRALVMKEIPLARPKEQLIGSVMSGVFLELDSDNDGVGYSVHYYEHLMSGSPNTRVIAVDGVEPTNETIRDRKYPYTCPVFVVTRKGLDEKSPARKLRNWLLSPEGQAVVRESGYVPLTSRER